MQMGVTHILSLKIRPKKLMKFTASQFILLLKFRENLLLHKLHKPSTITQSLKRVILCNFLSGIFKDKISRYQLLVYYSCQILLLLPPIHILLLKPIIHILLICTKSSFTTFTTLYQLFINLC